MEQVIKKVKEYAFIPLLLLAICSVVLCGLTYSRVSQYVELQGQLLQQMTQNQQALTGKMDVLMSALGDDELSADLLARLGELDAQQLTMSDQLTNLSEMIPLLEAEDEEQEPVVQVIREVIRTEVPVSTPAPTQEIAKEDIPLSDLAEEEVAEEPPAEEEAPVEEELPELAPTALKAGDKVEITISSNQINDMYAYEFRLYIDEQMFDYKAKLKSAIPDINTIFYNSFDGYILVGATKLGDSDGYSGEDVDICVITLEAKQDGEMPDFKIGDVNIVDSDNEYILGITGWSYDAGVAE